MVAILLGLQRQFLLTSRDGSVADLGWILLLVGSIVAFMAPLDFLGGYYVPSRFDRQSISFGSFIRGWTRGVATQAILFCLSSLVILTIGRNAGLFGVLVSITVMSIVYVGFQNQLVFAMTGRNWNDDDKVNRSLDRASRWGLKKLPATVVHNTDPGFTGGIVGLPRFESVIVPRDFVDQLTGDQLAVVLARRLVAVQSDARHFARSGLDRFWV